MRAGLVIILFIYFACLPTGNAQTLAPLVMNAGGGTSTIPSPNGMVTIYYNIGETITEDVKDAADETRVTQGFLQPDVIGTGALALYSYTTAMSCYSSNDASAALIAYGTNAPFRYRWFKNSVVLSDTSSTLLNLSSGTYSFEVIDKKGNSQSGSWDVLSGSGPCKLVIHNGLSPNSDGHNDFFYIEHIDDYPANNVSLYNRWGDQVWNAKGYNNTSVLWKGEDSQGHLLSAGTYYYIIELDGKKTTGWVELMR